MTNSITPEQHARVRAAFESVIDSAVSPERRGQSETLSLEEGQFLRQEVARLLWEPKLPNAGAPERKWLQQLRGLARDESLVLDLKMAAARYATSLETCLPLVEYIRKGNGWLPLPGCYYVRKPVTRSTNRELYEAAKELYYEATARKDHPKKWLAQFLLEGCPKPISNFRMECLYLLRKADGSVTRLVRLINTKGESSEGFEIGGADVLPNELFASSEKFRQFALSMGNFTWGCEGGAGNTELQMLQWDVTEEVAYREVKLIEYCGWHEIRTAKGSAMEPGKLFLNGLWFYDDCAITPAAEFILPDADGIFWHEGEGYVLSRKGREANFIQGRPRMHPSAGKDLGGYFASMKLDRQDWCWQALQVYEHRPLGGFYREVSRRFCDTFGNQEGYLVIGAVLAYLAAPEFFASQHNFPGLWVSGQMGSGKTTVISWLMSLVGFQVASGMGLISKNVSAVGIACQLENYSNLPLWLDEFRQDKITPDKEPMLRDPYGRQLAGKWTPDGIQRVIRTMPLVSGESTSSDAALRSRYPHVLISEMKRLVNHCNWMNWHQQFFFLFWRELSLRRREFVELFLRQVDFWLTHADLAKVPSRDRAAYAACFAGFTAAAGLLESHQPSELIEFRKFLVAHAVASAADVQTDVNVNVFLDELVVAYQAGAISNKCFRVENDQLAHPPGSPNQRSWNSYQLFIEPKLAIKELQIYLRKGNETITLRYKDLRDQLSRYDFWIKAPNSKVGLKRRFGLKGGMVSLTAWGILVDKHPLGTLCVPDEEFQAAQLPDHEKPFSLIGPAFREGDPRKGPLFTIIEGVLRAEAENCES